MNLDEEVEAMYVHIEALQKVLASLEDRLRRAKNAWPSHQILPAEWNDRSVTPPVGVIWCSDGVRVWLIKSEGMPIEPGATAVKYWTTAYIPAPPTVDNAIEGGTTWKL